jgi:hypothetical protein
MITTTRTTRRLLACNAALVMTTAFAAPAVAQWTGVYEQFYFPAGHNWAFRKNYVAADRLFNAFDYGHAILYETLYTKPAAPASLLEEDIFDRLTKRILVKPPRVPLEEAAIEIEYAKLVPEAKAMFDWAHILHRQIYDIWADERIPVAAKDARIAELLRYYRSRPDIAFSSKPKNMELMEGQFYSTAFRERYPKFNGLIWAYHWLQIGLYEPLVIAETSDQRKTGVTAAVARFWQMIEAAPDNMPRIMPMTAAVAPEFAARYPEAAIIFDNLHSMHDVISDILAANEVPRDQKRSEILRAAESYRDDHSFVMTEDEWREMSVSMGVQNMGGPAVGFLGALPEGTVARGAVMAGGAHAGHGRQAAADTMAAAPAATQADTALAGRTLNLLIQLLEDSVIRQRIVADSALHKSVLELIEHMPAEHREHLKSLLTKEKAGARTRTGTRTRVTARDSNSFASTPVRVRVPVRVPIPFLAKDKDQPLAREARLRLLLLLTPAQARRLADVVLEAQVNGAAGERPLRELDDVVVAYLDAEAVGVERIGHTQGGGRPGREHLLEREVGSRLAVEAAALDVHGRAVEVVRLHRRARQHSVRAVDASHPRHRVRGQRGLAASVRHHLEYVEAG